VSAVETTTIVNNNYIELSSQDARV
jgi:hypothetical protein